ncbi:uncharacterized protein ISCGN_006000 [Ixodes scapularis]
MGNFLRVLAKPSPEPIQQQDGDYIERHHRVLRSHLGLVMASGGKLPPEFLVKLGPPPIPWERWIKMFERYLLASGAQEFGAERRRAMLLNCLGEAGQQIYDALPMPEPAVEAALAPLAAAGGKQAVEAPLDVYKKTVKLLEAEFTQPANVMLQELQFHLRRQKEGEPLRDFLSAPRMLAANANFGSRTQDCIRKQFMIGVASTEIQERMVLDAALPFDVVMHTVMNLERSRREVREWASVAAPSEQTCQVTHSSDSDVRASRQPRERQSGRRQGHASRTPFKQPTHQHSSSQRICYETSPPPPRRSSSQGVARQRPALRDACATCGGSGRDPFSSHQQPRPRHSSDHRQDPAAQSIRSRSGSQGRQHSRRHDNFRHTRTCANCRNGPHRCQSYDTCPARNLYCYNCGRRGHLGRVCRSTRRDYQRSQYKQVEQVLSDYDDYEDDNVDDSEIVCHITESPTKKVYISPKVFGTPIQFLLDTGSSVSIMDKATFMQWFARDALVIPPPVTLLNYSLQPINILGAFKVMVIFKQRHAQVLFYIADQGTSLLGMDAVVALDIKMSGATRTSFYTATSDTGEASTSGAEQPSTSSQSPTLTTKSRASNSAVTSQLHDSSAALEEEWTERLLPPAKASLTLPTALAKPVSSLPRLPSSQTHFDHLFTPGLGRVKGVTCKIKVRSSVTPVKHRMRRIPKAARKQVSDEIKRLEEAGVIERINASEWVSPIVVVQKTAVFACVLTFVKRTKWS